MVRNRIKVRRNIFEDGGDKEKNGGDKEKNGGLGPLDIASTVGLLDIASTVAGALQTTAGAFADNARIADTSALESDIADHAYQQYTGTLDDLQNAYVAPLAGVSAKDIRGSSAGQRLAGALGAGIGSGGLGIVSGLIGSAVGNAKARNRATRLNAEIEEANMRNLRNYENAVDSANNALFNRSALNIAACGGVRRVFAEGGDTDPGAQWNDAAFTIDEGGSHETNPYGGVLSGVDPYGTPNLVEEGEVVWNDFVFSRRLAPTPEELKANSLPAYKGTYADIAGKLMKERAKRYNDPISKRGMDAQMERLARLQEAAKAAMDSNARAEGAAMAVAAADGRNEYGVPPESGYSPDEYPADRSIPDGAAALGEGELPELAGGPYEDANVMAGGGPALGPGVVGSGRLFVNAVRSPDVYSDLPSVDQTLDALGVHTPSRENKHLGQYAAPGNQAGLNAAMIREIKDRDTQSKYPLSNAVNGLSTSEIDAYVRNVAIPIRHSYKSENAYSPVGRSDIPVRETYIYQTPVKKVAGVPEYLLPYDQVYPIYRSDPRDNTKPINAKTLRHSSNVTPAVEESGFIGPELPAGFVRKNRAGQSRYGSAYTSAKESTANNVTYTAPVDTVSRIAPRDTTTRVAPAYTTARVRAATKAAPAASAPAASTPARQAARKASRPAVRTSAGTARPVTRVRTRFDDLLPETNNDRLIRKTRKGETIRAVTPSDSLIANAEIMAEDSPVGQPVYSGPTGRVARMLARQERRGRNAGRIAGLARFAPAVANSVQAITDILGLTNKPDYSNSRRVEAAARRLRDVSYTPSGERMTYRPMDLDYAANAARNDRLAYLRSAMASAGANRNALRSMIMQEGANAAAQRGDLYSKTREYNDNLARSVAQFNASVDQANASGALSAAEANQAVDARRLAAAQYAASLRNQEDALASAAQSNNRSAALSDIGNIGKELTIYRLLNELAPYLAPGSDEMIDPIYGRYACGGRKTVKRNRRK